MKWYAGPMRHQTAESLEMFFFLSHCSRKGNNCSGQPTTEYSSRHHIASWHYIPDTVYSKYREQDSLVGKRAEEYNRWVTVWWFETGEQRLKAVVKQNKM